MVRLFVMALCVVALYVGAFAFLAFHEAGRWQGAATPAQSAGLAR